MKRFLLPWVLLLFAGSASAHEVRPAYVEIAETAQHGYEILWKRPVMGALAVHLVPHLSGGWLDAKPASIDVTSSFAIETWIIPAGQHLPLDGQRLSIEGLSDTITDALILVRLADGSSWHTMLTPEEPQVTLRLGSLPPLALPAFLTLGIEHILTGIDHLLFVLGLVLIVGDRWKLLKTVTAFTIAHSLTLAIATLGYAHVPVLSVNAAIALSILFLGPEIVRRWRGETSWAIRQPWIVAFFFGLLHGFGFASGLTAVGLPQHDLLLALVLFNVGVEIGQLIFIALILWLTYAFWVLEIQLPRLLERLPGYMVGTLGAFWTIQRVAMLIGGGG